MLKQLAFAALVAALAAPALCQTTWGQGFYGNQREPSAVERTLGEIAAREHEKEMQQRQQAHEKEMQRLQAQTQQPPVAAPAAAPVVEYTQNLLNGRSWISWPWLAKVLYIMGGYEAALANDPGNGRLAGLLKTPATYGEVVAGIDEIYQDPTMRSVPIAYVVPILPQRLAARRRTKSKT